MTGIPRVAVVRILCLALCAPLLATAAHGAACTGGSAPSVEGTTLPDCFQRNFTIGGNNRIIRVWYTTDSTTYTVDGQSYVHGIDGEDQAEDVADAVQEGWESVFAHSALGGNVAHEPYIDGCSSVLNIQIRDGKGWAGIAYWGTPGNCNIGIDAPMIENGVGTGDDGVIFHEVQHYTQYSYDDGCYADFMPLYSAGNAWIEGWANWADNATNAASDANYSVASYNSDISYYDLSYTDLHAGYLIQQYGGNGAPGDAAFGVRAIYEHYRWCDQLDDVFVMDETIQALTAGAKTEKWAFVDFEAAYYAHDYADAATQPELVFPDTDDRPTGSPAFAQTVNLSSGSQSWTESSPDSWTGRYFRINPQSGCAFVELHAETQPPGGEIGINFLAADTSAPSIQRSAHIGDEATRFFAGFPANDQLVVNVASFDNAMTYEVSAACATPTLNILEPVHNPGHSLVGAPASPIATLTRFEVTSGGLPVSGVDPSTLTFDAEGDAPTLVAGSFQEVGPGQYWGVIVPPVKPGGTTFIDYQICLNTTICDTETDALLYVDPGNVDTVYVFDESGSMATEDTPGEGRRIDNAKRAGRVLPDLLKNGDRIGVIGHGGLDNPAGCGMPGGDGNCPNGNIVRLPRIDDVSVPASITVAKNAVDNVTDRSVWTNTGQGLIDAKDLLLANPGNTNPDRIILLSDGRENVHPLYDTPTVRGVLQTAGVCVDTIGLGPEAPGALLAQIAANHCGTYIPVPTSGLGTIHLAARESFEGPLGSWKAPRQLVAALSCADPGAFYPGQLGLANANEYLDVVAEDSSRLFHCLFRGEPTDTFGTQFATIDASVGRFQFLAAGKQPDSQGFRIVELLPPGMDPDGRWFPISPPNAETPTDWDVRNDPFQDAVIVGNPAPGTWGFRVRYGEIPGDYIMNLAVESPIRLEGSLLGLREGRGTAGDVVPVVATLLDRSGLIRGASVAAVINHRFGTYATLLLDDGQNHDGGAGDGIYGFPFSITDRGGSYGVRVVALFANPANPSESLLREWNGGFWIYGPEDDGEFDGDGERDGLPDDWERRCGLDVNRDDALEDLDRDGLVNLQELRNGTSPCRSDTDRGGEQDGSEVAAGRNPLWAGDDRASRITGLALRPLDRRVAISWSQRADGHTNVRVCVSETRGELGTCRDAGSSGEFILTGLTNGRTYWITLYGEGQSGAVGDFTDQIAVTPAEDPIPPQGAFFIGGPNVIEGGDVAVSRDVILFIDAADFDGELEGPAGSGSHSVPHGIVGPQHAGMYSASGGIEMRFSNSFTGIRSAAWEPLAPTRPWRLDCEDGALCTVFGQFRDKAGNESLVVNQRIRLRLGAAVPGGPRFGFSVHAGLASPGGGLSGSHDDGLAATIDFTRVVTAHWAWDLRLGYSELDGRAGIRDLEIWSLTAGAKYTVNPPAPVRVFLAGGAGLYDFSPGSSELGLNAGLGLSIPVAASVTFELTAKHHRTVTASPNARFNRYQVGLLRTF